MVIVGISGPSCSGKSVLAKALGERVGSACWVQQDWFFVDPELCPEDANFCDPRYVHVSEFLGVLRRLREGTSTAAPLIDFATFRRVGTRTLQPARYMLVEGMTIFRLLEVSRMCQYRYYLAPPFEVLERRKRLRDAEERGKSTRIIEAQLAWMRTEYAKDLEQLRNRVRVLDEASLETWVETILGDLDRAEAPGAELQRGT